MPARFEDPALRGGMDQAQGQMMAAPPQMMPPQQSMPQDPALGQYGMNPGQMMPPPSANPQLNPDFIRQMMQGMQRPQGPGQDLLTQALQSLSPPKPSSYQKGAAIGGELFDNIVLPLLGSKSDAAALGVHELLKNTREDKQKATEAAAKQHELKTQSLLTLSQLMEHAHTNDLAGLAQAYTMDQKRVENEQFVAKQRADQEALRQKMEENRLHSEDNRQWRQYVADQGAKTAQAKLDAGAPLAAAKTEDLKANTAFTKGAKTDNVVGKTEDSHKTAGAAVVNAGAHATQAGEVVRHDKATEGQASAGSALKGQTAALAALTKEINDGMKNGMPQEKLDQLMQHHAALVKQVQSGGQASASTGNEHLDAIKKRFKTPADMAAYLARLKAGKI